MLMVEEGRQVEAHTVTLASGNTATVTPYSIRIATPESHDLKVVDIADVQALGRTGATVGLRDKTGFYLSMECASLEDAGQLEADIRTALRDRGQPVALLQHIATTLAPPPPTSRKRALLITGGVALVALTFAIVGTTNGIIPLSGQRTVVYRVTDSADGRVDVTYENRDGNTEQIDEVRTTWTKTVRMERRQFMYVSAQRQGGNGTVRCEIEVNGEVVETSRSSGEFVIATCSGKVP